MNQVRISDFTMKHLITEASLALSFREKIELAGLLDRLNVDVIELEGIRQTKVDSLRVKSIASAVSSSILSVPVERLEEDSVNETWEALKLAVHPRLQVTSPVSAVQMEYICGMKPPKMLEAVKTTIAQCRALCGDVEYLADDATRADSAFLYNILEEAIAAGASTVTVCDAAGNMLPDEFGAFIHDLYENVPSLKNVTLGVSVSNALSMADACALAAVREGAREIKAAAYAVNTISLPGVTRALTVKGEALGISCAVRTTEMRRITRQIRRLVNDVRGGHPLRPAAKDPMRDSIILSPHDDKEAVTEATRRLGYDLSEEDLTLIYEEFTRLAEGREQIDARELEAIVAAVSSQVPETYKLESYLISSGSSIKAMAQLKLLHNDETLEGVCLGNGPIDAAFVAVEQITNAHYELDDFQIQSITQGQEAMGQAIIKLRSEGKLYSGRGVSRDIVGASILAYINAINKIHFEEEEA